MVVDEREGEWAEVNEQRWTFLVFYHLLPDRVTVIRAGRAEKLGRELGRGEGWRAPRRRVRDSCGQLEGHGMKKGKKRINSVFSFHDPPPPLYRLNFFSVRIFTTHF